MIAKFFSRKSEEFTSRKPIDFDKVHDSFNLLKQTALEVAHTASTTASVLEKEQRRTRACFTALNSASDIIFIVDNDRKLYFVNDTFLEVFSFQHHDDVVGRELNDVLPDVDNYDLLWQRVTKNKTWEDVFRTYKFTIMPMMNGHSEPIYYICTMKPLPTKHK